MSEAMRRLRQWWCGRRHDKGYRFHSWRMIDGKGSIQCRRCKVIREGSQPDGGAYMAALLRRDADLFR